MVVQKLSPLRLCCISALPLTQAPAGFVGYQCALALPLRVASPSLDLFSLAPRQGRLFRVQASFPLASIVPSFSRRLNFLFLPSCGSIRVVRAPPGPSPLKITIAWLQLYTSLTNSAIMRMGWGAARKAGVSLVELSVWKPLPLGPLLLAVLPTHLEGVDEFHFIGGRVLVREKRLRMTLRPYCVQAPSKEPA